jgi:hypothetical protein
MHKAVIFLLIILLSKTGFSQLDIINNTLLSPDSNTLYIGISNAIKIINTKNPFFEIRAASRGLSSTHDPYVFELRATKPGWDTVFVFNGDEMLIQKAFKIVFLPPVEAKLGTLRVDEATQEEIYINGWLVLLIPNCKCTPSYTVSSFELGFESDEVNEDVMQIEGDRLTTKARKIIKSLKPGDVVYFDHIIAKNEAGTSIEVAGFNITVK